MTRRALLGIAALLPAALGTAPATAHAIAVPLCDGGGVVRMVTLATDGPAPAPPQDGQGCCAKGCHTGMRKKIVEEFEPEQ